MQTSETGSLAHIPSGVADHFWADAILRDDYEATLLAGFRQWGYADVVPPAFEFANTFDARANPELRQELHRFVDRDGSLLALRADMTIPVARLVATRLHDAPMPQRFCYAGSIYRYADTRAGQQREFWQAGVELIGEAGPAADAEVLALTVASLGRLGLQTLRLAVGHLGYFDALISDLALDDAARADLLDAVDRNSEAALLDFLQHSALSEPQRHAVASLPHLSGLHSDEILVHARALCLNHNMHAALHNLIEILDAYKAYVDAGIAHASALYVDLTEIHNLGYYTGLTFEALTPGIGYAVASGGRYDHLVGTFGEPQPAVGVALNLDRLIYLQHSLRPLAALPLPPDVLVGGSPGAGRLASLATLRAAHPGLRIALDLRDRDGVAEFAAHAQQIRAPLSLWWNGSTFKPCGGPTITRSGPEWSLAEAVAALKELDAAQQQRVHRITQGRVFP